MRSVISSGQFENKILTENEHNKSNNEQTLETKKKHYQNNKMTKYEEYNKRKNIKFFKYNIESYIE